MTKIYQIFIPELVPLENKGEEAIVRGIADVIFPGRNCELHLFDEVDEYRYMDGIHVYPVKWFISPWLNREFGLGANWGKIRDSFYSLTRNGLHKLWPNWVTHRCSALQETANQMRELVVGKNPLNEKDRCLLRLLNCDYVVVGHDGALDERVCHVVDVMREFGKSFGVFGVEFPSAFKSQAIINVEFQTLRHSQFFYCRTDASNSVAKQHFPGIDSKVLADPAFGMEPAEDEEVSKLIDKEGLGRFFDLPVVLCTSCEPPPISRHCFEDVKIPDLKLVAHRDLFAELVKHVVNKYNVNILFLPHAIGPGPALDDRIIARDILKRARLPKQRATVLETSISAKLLKGLIKRGEFLIAERIHSMIGAVGVNTPFLCVGSNTDRRIRGIIEQMVGMKNEVYHLNSPSTEGITGKFDEAWGRRHTTRIHLSEVYAKMRVNLEDSAANMREKITLAKAP
jgi:polysaccharide pyruvyl transferase WcaK-like protein